MDNNEVLEKFDKCWAGHRKFNFFSRIVVWLMDKAILKIIKEFRPEKLLEIGCGSGRTMAKLRNLVSLYVGIDNSPASIELCKKIEKNIFLMKADDLKFKDNEFDFIYSEGLLEHYKNFEPFVKEMTRVSKKYILILQPNFHSFAGKLLALGTKLLKKDNPIELPYRKSDYIKVFEKYGCQKVFHKSAVFGAFTLFLFEK